MQGFVFNIQRFSIHDGPGIRTTVFLQGCSLRCFWCHNPESIYQRPLLQFYRNKCVGCGKCVEVCPVHAHQVREKQRVYVRELCLLCGRCSDTCYAEALMITGKSMTTDQVLEEIEKDRIFYDKSGGGVTFSGGEPLLQKDFLKTLLKECKSRGFHTTIDTAGNVSWKAIDELLPYVDLWLFDLKTIDREKHQAATGTDNVLIVENLTRLARTGAEITIRIPVIPGFNDSNMDMERAAGFIAELKTVKLTELLPFHRLGEGKYESLGMTYLASGLTPPSEESMKTLAGLFARRGLKVEARS